MIGYSEIPTAEKEEKKHRNEYAKVKKEQTEMSPKDFFVIVVTSGILIGDAKIIYKVLKK